MVIYTEEEYSCLMWTEETKMTWQNNISKSRHAIWQLATYFAYTHPCVLVNSIIQFTQVINAYSDLFSNFFPF